MSRIRYLYIFAFSDSIHPFLQELLIKEESRTGFRPLPPPSTYGVKLCSMPRQCSNFSPSAASVKCNLQAPLKVDCFKKETKYKLFEIATILVFDYVLQTYFDNRCTFNIPFKYFQIGKLERIQRQLSVYYQSWILG